MGKFQKRFFYSAIIALSLAKRIINIVTDNRGKILSELKKYLTERNHPHKIIDYTFTKCF